MTNEVMTFSPDYSNVLPRWQLVRAIVNNYAENYIRTPDVNNIARSNQYKKDAILTNFTNLTRVGLVGIVFRKPPTITLPDDMLYLEDDVTGSGINAVQFGQHVVSELLITGRYGFLADYHEDGERAFIKPYSAENITNWKTRVIDGRCVLSLVVLKESVLSDSESIFTQNYNTQYRVLWLDENNIYNQMCYTHSNNDEYKLVSQKIPTDYNGNFFNYIPFVFAGSENNDWAVDYQPLYDLSVVNLGHYRNSADYEESIFITGQPYLVVNVGESSEEEFIAANPGGINFGSRKALVVSTGGSAVLLQANPNQLVAQAMREKIEQAASIGARLISPAGGRETAEAAKIRYGSQHSALYTITSNVGWALTKSLKFVAMFMGADPEFCDYELNDEFFDEVADANLLAQQILLMDRGVIAKEDIRDYGRRTGFISADRTDADLEADAEMIDPLGDNFNDNARPDFTAPVVADASSENPS